MQVDFLLSSEAVPFFSFTCSSTTMLQLLPLHFNMIMLQLLLLHFNHNVTVHVPK